MNPVQIGSGRAAVSGLVVSLGSRTITFAVFEPRLFTCKFHGWRFKLWKKRKPNRR